MSWSKRFAPVIARVLAETAGQDPRAVRRAFTAAYPAGERAQWPYKVWCRMVREAMGMKTKRQAAELAALKAKQDAQAGLFH